MSHALKSYLCLDSDVQVSKNLHQDLQSLPSEWRLLLWCDDVRMLTSLEPALCNAWKRVDHFDTDVLLANVAIEVGEYLQNVVRVLTKSIKKLEYTVLVIILRVSRSQYLKEKVVSKNRNGLLKVLSEVEEEAVEDTDGSWEDFMLTWDGKF